VAIDPDQVVAQPPAPYAIYVAAPLQLRHLAQMVMGQLEREGYVVTSDWLRGDPLSDEQAATAIDHLSNIDRADALVLLNPEAWRDAGTGGRHFEAGYAFKAGKDVFVVGARTQTFHYRPAVKIVTQPELLLAALRMHLVVTRAKATA
jgi:nucleoside 2-deoxyribosyltransferase